MSELLAGRFALSKKIGDGTFAEVWLGIDQGSDPPGARTALKLFRDPDEGAGDWAPFEREVSASVRLGLHPNIVTSWAAFRCRFSAQAETPCLALEYVQGANLALWLAGLPPPGPTSIGERVAVMHGVLNGLAHVHGHRVIHHDLSFGNILIQQSGVPIGRLTDFGCAQVLPPSVTEPAVAGADPVAQTANNDTDDTVLLQPINPPPYSLNLSLAQGIARDIYAFAVLCSLAFTGRHPLTDAWMTMRGDQWRGVAAPHSQLHRRGLMQLAPWLAEQPPLAALAMLLDRCLDADPAARPDSARLLSDWNALGLDLGAVQS